MFFEKVKCSINKKETGIFRMNLNHSHPKHNHKKNQENFIKSNMLV